MADKDLLTIVSARERLVQREIALRKGDTEIGVDTFGGLVTYARVKEFDVIVPRTTSNTKRCGIPRLGPVAGPVEDTAWALLYPKMPSHGTDRISPMSLVSYSEESVFLEGTEGPRSFKGVWRTTLEVKALDDGLVVVQKVANLEDKPSVRAVAFHPYFSGSLTVIQPNGYFASSASGETHEGVDELVFQIDKKLVTVNFSPTPRQIVDWQENNHHRCLEPWWATKGDGWIFGPGEEIVFRMEIRCRESRSSSV